MASKRDIASVSSSEKDDPTWPPASKRQRGKQPTPSQSKQHSDPKTDLTYGQRCVFPGLDGSVPDSDDDLEFEDEQDAMAYLRSVRQEASGIPHLLVAPRAGPQLPSSSDLDYNDAGPGVDRSIYTNGKGDFRGYYHDGAYTAAPDSELNEDDDTRDPTARGHDADTNDEEANAERLNQAYYTSLITQFTSLRALLHRDPPPTPLPHGRDADVRPFGARSKTFTIWSARLRHTDPLPAQVAAMDKAGVVRLLRVVLGGKFLRRGTELRERTSRWLWALLARLPERGELDHVEVGVVRELGKRAVLMLTTLAEMVALREEVELDEGPEGEEEDEERWEAEEGLDDGDGDGDENGAEGALEGSSGDLSRADVTPAREHEQEAEDEEMEDGEVSDEPTAADMEADIAAAKARLLAGVEGIGSVEEAELAPERSVASDNEEEEEEVYDEARARVNMRATLNMILTVAGEFYGQRDLLEFRDPFMGL